HDFGGLEVGVLGVVPLQGPTSNFQLPTPKQHNLEIGSWCLGSCPATRTSSQLPSSTTWRLEVGVLGVVPLQGPAPNSQAGQLGGRKLVSWELSRSYCPRSRRRTSSSTLRFETPCCFSLRTYCGSTPWSRMRTRSFSGTLL